MITVDVKFFGNLRHYVPNLALGESLSVEVPAHTTAGELAQKLKIPTVKLIVVNGIGRKEAFALSDGDEIAFIPPVSGG